MNDAIVRMLDRHQGRSVGDYVRALREILQEVALLGLWRSKFFEKAAFYGGTALRILYGRRPFFKDEAIVANFLDIPSLNILI